MTSWYDQDGIKRCRKYERSDLPPTCTILIQSGQISGMIYAGKLEVEVVPAHPITPNHLRVVRPDE